MNGTHTLTELRNTKGFLMHKNGIITTTFGSRTTNYWRETENNLYYNYNCTTNS